MKRCVPCRFVPPSSPGLDASQLTDHPGGQDTSATASTHTTLDVRYAVVTRPTRATMRGAVVSGTRTALVFLIVIDSRNGSRRCRNGTDAGEILLTPSSTACTSDACAAAGVAP